MPTRNLLAYLLTYLKVRHKQRIVNIPGDAVGESCGDPAGDRVWLINDGGLYERISFSNVLNTNSAACKDENYR